MTTLNLNAKTLFGWSWSNDGISGLATSPPESVGTVNVLANDAPWDCPVYKSSNYHGTCSRFYLHIGNNVWHPIKNETYYLIRNFGVSRTKITINDNGVLTIDAKSMREWLYDNRLNS